MKKTYIIPVAKVHTLSVKTGLLQSISGNANGLEDTKFGGNTSDTGAPSSTVGGDTKADNDLWDNEW